MDEYPFVSCICPTFNRIAKLEEMLESFLRQDYPGRKELIILNDCPAQTLHFDHPEVRIINWTAQCKSLGKKHRALVGAAKGEYISVWDDDDIKLPRALSFSVDMMRRNRLELFYPDKSIVSYNNSVYRVLNKPSFHMNGMWTRALYDRTTGYDPNTEHPDGLLQALFLAALPDFKEYGAQPSEVPGIIRVDSGVRQISYAHNEDSSDAEASRL